MHSLSSAVRLLAAASSSVLLGALAAALGFTAPPLLLDHAALAALGLPEVPVRHVRIVAGPGALCLLLAEWDGPSSLRDAVAAVAERLAVRAPQRLWLLMITQRGASGLAIATWSAAGPRPRIAVLLVDRDHVLPSDADTFLALAYAAGSSDLLTHAGWMEVLGREALSRRFYRALERVVGELARQAPGRLSVEERSELALLQVSRLIFLSFLESKGWLSGDRRFLERGFAECMAQGGEYHRRVLLPLFFGTLNTPPEVRAPAARAFGRIPFLNGGLFAPTPLERRRREVRFPDEALGLIFGELLTRYRFTAREESAGWSEAAIDPEMLGKAFESLMASRARRSSGAFYTPHALVAAITHTALMEVLPHGSLTPGLLEGALRGEPLEGAAARALRERVHALRLVDPACGSGAFLVHALEQLAALAGRAGDPRPVAMVRREVLTRSIFGVDVNPMAVWLCELRLWLSIVIESEEADPLAVIPLPNLDRHIRVGDALAGAPFDSAPPPGSLALARLRERYARAAGARKHTLQRELDRAERAAALDALERALARCSARRTELLAALRGRDLFGERPHPGAADRRRLARERAHARELKAALRTLRDGGALPFAWTTHFPDAAYHGGFDVVIGNPPWVRLHRIPPSMRSTLRERYRVFRGAVWERGARLARAGRGFAAQVDLAALFVERSLTLLREGGTLALLLPAKLWRSLAGGGLRRLLTEGAQLVALEDWSESPRLFTAAVYPSVLVARRTGAAPDPAGEGTPPCVRAAMHHRSGSERWVIPREQLALEPDPASPWLLVPPPVRAAFDRLADAGVALGESSLGAPQLGVKCGCNEAFLVRLPESPPRGREQARSTSGALVPVESGGRRGLLECELLRPALRGESIAPWRAANPSSTARDRIVWTHDRTGAPLRMLPPYARRWLTHWRGRLARRADVRPGVPWWALFRTQSASTATARVVWADLARTPRALVLPPGDPTVPLNTCYVLPCREELDAFALAALLNSPLAAAWLHVLAEPARGTYRRYLAWTVALLPVPRDWRYARALLAPVARRAAAGDEVAPEEFLELVLRAYRLPRAERWRRS